MGEATFSYVVTATFTEARVVLEGELDMAESAAFTADVLARTAGFDVILEAAGLSFCDSAGIVSFVKIADASHRAGNRFRMVGATPNLARIVDILGLSGTLGLSSPRAG